MSDWVYVSCSVPKSIEPNRDKAREMCARITGRTPIREMERLKLFYFYLSSINHFDEYKTSLVEGCNVVEGRLNSKNEC